MSVVSTFGCHSLAARQHNNRGMALANEGRYEDAISEFTEAIELDPAYALGYNNRGWAYSEKGQYDLATADLSKAIELNPELAVAYSNRGSAYNNKGQLELAIADLNKVLELSTDPILIRLAQLRIAELEPTAMPVEPSATGPGVEIIIYTDFQCTACAELHLEVEQELLRLYVDTGKASLQMRLLSTLGPESSRAAQAALCAVVEPRGTNHSSKLSIFSCLILF